MIEMERIIPGQTIGIVGQSPQLRKLVSAAHQLGFVVHHYVENSYMMYTGCDRTTIQPYHDRIALLDFAMQVDALLTIGKVVKLDDLVAMSRVTSYLGSLEVIEIEQEKMVERVFLEENRINIAPYGFVSSVSELESVFESVGFPAVISVNHQPNETPTRIIFDKDIEEEIAAMVEQTSVISSWIVASRYFEISVIRDFDGIVHFFPITENIYKDDSLQCSIASMRLNPEWTRELQNIATKVLETIQGNVTLSIFVILDNHGIFYVDSVQSGVSIAHRFSTKQIRSNVEQVMIRQAVGLPIPSIYPTEELVNVMIYDVMKEKVELLAFTKPEWEIEYFDYPTESEEIIGILRLSGPSYVDLLNELESCDVIQVKERFRK